MCFIQLLVTLMCLVAAIVSFYSPILGWLVLGIPICFLSITAIAVTRSQWTDIPELSDDANRMFKKFGHYYTRPLSGGDYSAACSAVNLAAIIIVVIDVFFGFWWGILLGIGVYLLFGYLGRVFNPTHYLVDDVEKFAHDEIVNWLAEKNNSNRD